MSSPSRQPVTDTDIANRVRLAVGAAQDRKALDLLVLQVQKVCDFTDYFVLCSGTSARQVLAIGETIQERLREQRLRPLHVEGLREGNWALLDYGDFVVHVFDQDRREFYRLDRLWSSSTSLCFGNRWDSSVFTRRIRLREGRNAAWSWYLSGSTI